MAQEPIFNTKLKALPDQLKAKVETRAGDVFNIRAWTTSNKIWKGISLIFAILFLAAAGLLGFFEARSYPDYMFSLWLFIVISVVLLCGVIILFAMFFEGLSAQLNSNKHYMVSTPDEMIIRADKRITLIPWLSISDCIVKRRESDSTINAVSLLVSSANKKSHFMIPDLYSDNFSKIYTLAYSHLKKKKEEIPQTAPVEWKVFMGISIYSESLPNYIRDLLLKRNHDHNVLYFKARDSYLKQIFMAVLGFMFMFGFVMTIIDLFTLSDFWGIGLDLLSFNLRLFLAIMLGLFAIASLAMIVVSLIHILKTKKRQLIISPEGIVERVLGIVYVIPWKSIKEITAKWFSEGVVENKGQMDIQIIYSDSPKSRATHKYSLHGSYNIDSNKLVALMNQHWKK